MKKVLFLLLSFALLVSSGMAATFHVAVTGDDVNDGSTWLQAKCSIQAAVDAAADGDVILVSNGVYTATADQVVSIEKSVDIRGVNGPDVTIIDGGNSRRCVYSAPPNNGSPIYLSGFAICNGNASQGAGVYKSGYRDFYLSNCVIHANTCSEDGAGIYKTLKNSQMVVTDCIISNNLAARSGAGGYSRNAGRLFMFNCDIVNNISTNAGGGISGISSDYSGTVFELHDCRIADNTSVSNSGGGIYFNSNAGATGVVNNCIVEYNHALSGGGVYHRYLGDLFITNCIIRGNEVDYTQGYAGAGVRIYGPGRMTGCLIAGNKVTAAGGHGGGVALYTSDKVFEVDNCTIVSNSIMGDCGGGLALSKDVTAACTIRNTIIYNNTSVGNARSNVFVGAGSGVIFTNCCTAPLNNGTDQPITPDAGNIDLDPVFVNLTGGDYRLQSDSPCINTGANMLWMADAVDLDGRCRLDRFSRQVDMGCYEYVPQGAMFNLR